MEFCRGFESQRVSVILGRVDEVENMIEFIFSLRLLELQISLISC